MSFLTSQPDLSNTIFTDKHLQMARDCLQSIISQVDKPWLKKPQGILGEYWIRDDTYAACYLIDIARMLTTIDNKIATKSFSQLREKTRQLLRPPSYEQFLELLTEIQVAFALVQYVSPLIFLTSEDIIEPKVQRSPDFAFQTSEGIVLVETTVFHGGILDKWTQAASYIRVSIQNHLFKHNRALNVHISLPLKAEMDEKQIVSIVLKEIDSTDTGSVSIGDKGVIKWEPFPIIKLQNLASFPTDISSPTAAYITGGTIDRAYACSTQIVFPTEEDVRQARELVLKSLRRKLKEKKDQFPKDKSEPHLIVMRVENKELGEGDIAAMLRVRIWPNKNEYDWLSGMVLFTPIHGFSLAEDNVAYLKHYPNPNAACPPTDALMKMFNGEATFHL